MTLCGLGQLDVVDVSGNRITCVPDGMESLQAVEVNLNMNQVSVMVVVVSSSSSSSSGSGSGSGR